MDSAIHAQQPVVGTQNLVKEFSSPPSSSSSLSSTAVLSPMVQEPSLTLTNAQRSILQLVTANIDTRTRHLMQSTTENNDNVDKKIPISLIHGPPGTGKSVLLRKLCDDLQQQQKIKNVAYTVIVLAPTGVSA